MRGSIRIVFVFLAALFSVFPAAAQTNRGGNAIVARLNSAKTSRSIMSRQASKVWSRDEAEVGVVTCEGLAVSIYQLSLLC